MSASTQLHVRKPLHPCSPSVPLAEHGRLGPSRLFRFPLVDACLHPSACWTWNPTGWSNKHGGLDFAGGTPVPTLFIRTAALAISIFLGKRRGYRPLLVLPTSHTTPLTSFSALFSSGLAVWFLMVDVGRMGRQLACRPGLHRYNLAASVGGLTGCCGITVSNASGRCWFLLWGCHWPRSNHPGVWLCRLS